MKRLYIDLLPHPYPILTRPDEVSQRKSWLLVVGLPSPLGPLSQNWERGGLLLLLPAAEVAAEFVLHVPHEENSRIRRNELVLNLSVAEVRFDEFFILGCQLSFFSGQ
jgi:hypothetical protein